MARKHGNRIQARLPAQQYRYDIASAPRCRFRWHGSQAADCRRMPVRSGPRSLDSAAAKSRWIPHFMFRLPKLARNRLRDKQHMRTLRKLGWKVLVVWECQVKGDGLALPRRLGAFLDGDSAGGLARTAGSGNSPENFKNAELLKCHF